MSTHRGKTVVLEDEEERTGGVGGKRGLLPGGKGAVYDDDGNCAFCCGCEPKVLGYYTTNSSTPIWNLRPYLGPGKAPPHSYWRVIEVEGCLLYYQGCVDKQGRLVDLPDEFRSNYSYNGYMELQIGCYDPKDGLIHWPGTCQSTSYRYYIC